MSFVVEELEEVLLLDDVLLEAEQEEVVQSARMATAVLAATVMLALPDESTVTVEPLQRLSAARILQ